jgi:hypothetical protein
LHEIGYFEYSCFASSMPLNFTFDNRVLTLSRLLHIYCQLKYKLLAAEEADFEARVRGELAIYVMLSGVAKAGFLAACEQCGCHVCKEIIGRIAFANQR